jgi:hypothetical protein
MAENERKLQQLQTEMANYVGQKPKKIRKKKKSKV